MDVMKNALLNGDFTTDMLSKQLTAPDPTTLNVIPSQVTVSSTARVDEPDHSADPTPAPNPLGNNDDDITTGKNFNFNSPTQFSCFQEESVVLFCCRRIHKIAQRVKVAVINFANASGAIESTASSREIIGALQTSISASKNTLNQISTPMHVWVPEFPKNPNLSDIIDELLDWAKNKSEAMLNPPSTSVRTKRKGGNTIKKSTIEVALKMGTTALAHAINMTRIINIYYDGPQRSSEVVERVEATGATDCDALTKFLVQ
ncbi:hypothetical protein C8J57DRAFT_1229500 [Mycena rebaudengoi]|nr:hypothetical protein C8J57DRAFT_1229500 [Mycena rebaudengoi]